MGPKRQNSDFEDPKDPDYAPRQGSRARSRKKDANRPAYETAAQIPSFTAYVSPPASSPPGSSTKRARAGRKKRAANVPILEPIKEPHTSPPTGVLSGGQDFASMQMMPWQVPASSNASAATPSLKSLQTQNAGATPFPPSGFSAVVTGNSLGRNAGPNGAGTLVSPSPFSRIPATPHVMAQSPRPLSSLLHGIANHEISPPAAENIENERLRVLLRGPQADIEVIETPKFDWVAAEPEEFALLTEGPYNTIIAVGGVFFPMNSKTILDLHNATHFTRLQVQCTDDAFAFALSHCNMVVNQTFCVNLADKLLLVWGASAGSCATNTEKVQRVASHFHLRIPLVLCMFMRPSLAEAGFRVERFLGVNAVKVSNLGLPEALDGPPPDLLLDSHGVWPPATPVPMPAAPMTTPTPQTSMPFNRMTTSTPQMRTSFNQMTTPTPQTRVPVNQMTTPPVRARMPVPQMAGQVGQTRMPAPQMAGQIGQTKMGASQMAAQVDQTGMPVSQMAGQIGQARMSVSQMAGQAGQTRMPIAQMMTPGAQTTTPGAHWMTMPASQMSTPVAQAILPEIAVGLDGFSLPRTSGTTGTATTPFARIEEQLAADADNKEKSSSQYSVTEGSNNATDEQDWGF